MILQTVRDVSMLYMFTHRHGNGEIPVFLGCPDVDPMHSPKIAAVSSLNLNKKPFEKRGCWDQLNLQRINSEKIFE